MTALLRKAVKITLFPFWHEEMGVSTPEGGANLPSRVLTQSAFTQSKIGNLKSKMVSANHLRPRNTILTPFPGARLTPRRRGRSGCWLASPSL